MNDDRLMVAQAVLEGKIGEEHLTQREVDELFVLVAERAFEKCLQEAEARGLNVFVGFDGGDDIH